MAYATVPTVATSDSWTASQHNTYIKDNFSAVWVGTTAGDMEYYTGATAKTRLALSAGGLLYAGASAPAYLPLVANGILYGGASAPAYLAAGANYTFLKSNGTAPSYGALTYRRQGGSSTHWNTAGTSSYTPTKELIQRGVIPVSVSVGVGSASVTFTQAYTYNPHITGVLYYSVAKDISAPLVYSISTTGFSVRVIDPVSDTFSVDFAWVASGE